MRLPVTVMPALSFKDVRAVVATSSAGGDALIATVFTKGEKEAQGEPIKGVLIPGDPITIPTTGMPRRLAARRPDARDRLAHAAPPARIC